MEIKIPSLEEVRATVDPVLRAKLLRVAEESRKTKLDIEEMKRQLLDGEKKITAAKSALAGRVGEVDKLRRAVDSARDVAAAARVQLLEDESTKAKQRLEEAQQRVAEVRDRLADEERAIPLLERRVAELEAEVGLAAVGRGRELCHELSQQFNTLVGELRDEAGRALGPYYHALVAVWTQFGELSGAVAREADRLNVAGPASPGGAPPAWSEWLRCLAEPGAPETLADAAHRETRQAAVREARQLAADGEARRREERARLEALREAGVPAL